MNEKSKQIFNVDDVIKKVGELPKYLHFINNVCLIEFIKERYKSAQKYDSFFLKNEDGKVKELWGVFGTSPDMDAYAYRISQAINGVK
jgi:thioredoxin-related protein